MTQTGKGWVDARPCASHVESHPNRRTPQVQPLPVSRCSSRVSSLAPSLPTTPRSPRGSSNPVPSRGAEGPAAPASRSGRSLGQRRGRDGHNPVGLRPLSAGCGATAALRASEGPPSLWVVQRTQSYTKAPTPPRSEDTITVWVWGWVSHAGGPPDAGSDHNQGPCRLLGSRQG